jgi:glycosyltransferase involved in cell wall biosynthesis
MRVAMLCPQSVPPVTGGAERLWQGTVDAFNERTEHHATLVAYPSAEGSLIDLVGSYLFFDRLDLNDYDMVVTGKYPAWMVRHPRHVVYMCHTLRGLYDTYPSEFSTQAAPASPEGRRLLQAVYAGRPGRDEDRQSILWRASDFVASVAPGSPDLDFPGPLARALVHWLDQDALHPSRTVRHAAISGAVARREGYFPIGVQPTVIVPPSGLAGLHVAEASQAFFTASRLDGPKRIGLIIDAFRSTPGDFELRIAGTGPLAASLRASASADPRVHFLGRISDQELAHEYATALAVPFVPYEEDLGLIAIEAQMSGKPVITCSDSGGSADLVIDGIDGWVVEPTARSLSQAFVEATDRVRSAEMGLAGRYKAERLTWDAVVQGLLAVDRETKASPRRSRVLALSTYAAEPARHGGQIRINRLYRELGKVADIDLLVLGSPAEQPTTIAVGVVQRAIEPSPLLHQINDRLSRESGVPSGDIAASLSFAADDDLAKAIRQLPVPDVILLSHPYLYPYIRSLPQSIPVIYDAHNNEGELKSAIYPAHRVGRAMAEAVVEVERSVLRRATLVITVSDSDSDSLTSQAPSMATFCTVSNGSDVSSTEFVTGDERRDRRRRYLKHLRASGWNTPCSSIAVFVGSQHPPNIAAAMDVLAVASLLPETLFILLGGHATALGGVPSAANVLARGLVEPEELGFYLSACDVALNPMRSGSGTNLKMADYFAAGAPVISSTIGARGFPVADGHHFLLADTIEELRDAVKQSVEDDLAADRRAVAAREVALAFDWPTLGVQFADEVMSVIAHKRM